MTTSRWSFPEALTSRWPPSEKKGVAHFFRVGHSRRLMAANERELGVGTRVLVRNRFLAEFAPGFEVAGVTPTGYTIRRVSDGAELPSSFPADEVRADRS